MIHHPRKTEIWIASLLIALIVMLVLAGCSRAEPQSTPTLTEIAASSTTIQTALPPTDTPTLTLSMTLTASPSSTNTPPPSETPTSSPTVTETIPPPTPSSKDAILIYLIQLDTDGPVACGDSLVPINTGVWRSGDVAADVAEALRRLFVKQEYIAGLYNPSFLSNISVDSVDFRAFSEVVSIRLSGTYVRSGDRCDDGRVRAQVWTTIRQFSGIKTVDILLNGNLLGDILATRQMK